jgi:hypothetical protein
MRKLWAWLYFEWQLYKHKIKPYLTWTLAPSMLIAWLITNSWLYIFTWLAIKIHSPLMISISSAIALAYWILPEKLLTIPLGFFIQKILFIRRNKYENCR